MKLISPLQEIVDFPEDVRAFTKEQELDYAKFIRLVENKCNSYMGWRILERQPTLKNPEGQVVVILGSQTEFAKEHNMGLSSLTHLIKGKLKSFNGWTLIKKDEGAI